MHRKTTKRLDGRKTWEENQKNKHPIDTSLNRAGHTNITPNPIDGTPAVGETTRQEKGKVRPNNAQEMDRQ